MSEFKRNGNDYAWDILRRTKDVRDLLKEAHNQETVWLEFKADPFCRRDSQKLTDDAIWHTLKAIVSMVNTRGGCIVFGVDDKAPHAVVELCDSSGLSVVKNTLDHFHREITEKFLRKTKLKIRGKSDANQHYELSHSIERYCELKAGVVCDGKPVSVLLVKPSDKNLFVWVKINNNENDKRLYVRQPGDNGMCKRLATDEILQWKRPGLDFDCQKSDKKFDNMLSPVSDFIGRKDVLRCIDQCFTRQKSSIPLLYGVAGIGKSEIAYKYAAERNSDYDTLIRINASRYKSLFEVFAEIVKNSYFKHVFFGGNCHENEDREDWGIMFFRGAVAEGRLGRVLLVLDDVRHPNIIRPAIFNSYLGAVYGSDFNVIVTTRYPLLRFVDGELVEPIEVGPLSVQEGIKLLARKRDISSAKNPDCAETIVNRLGGNPWAIDIVGEYLKQKLFQNENDLDRCLKSLQESLVDFFPPKEYGTMLIGNATGITDIGTLFGPTICNMQSEEYNICILIAMTKNGSGFEVAFRTAFERLYGRCLNNEEWRAYIEMLKKKCLLCEEVSENGESKISIIDGMFFDYFKSLKKENEVIDAFLEYISVMNRMSLTDAKSARFYFDFLENCDCEKERKAEVVYDEERCGWPLCFMGVDLCRVNLSNIRDGVFGNNEVKKILGWAANVPQLRADVMEVEYLINQSLDVKNVRTVLKMREEIYKDNPLMLGRSYMHAEEMGRGDVFSLEERRNLLEKAERNFVQCEGDNKSFCGRAVVLWSKASILEERVNYDCELTKDDIEKYRGDIRNLLSQAQELCPDVFADVEDIDSYIEDGVCP